MITAFVQIKLPKPISVDEAQTIFRGTAPNYLGMAGLVRKYYILSDDGGTAGGVYLWESQDAAEKVYTEAWQQFIKEKYGTLPVVTYFHSPVVVDNPTATILEE